MENVRKALKLQQDAQRRRALAPDYDKVRRSFELGLADEMEQEAKALITPANPLQRGLGGEVLPQAQHGLPGLELTLKEPDLLNLSASVQRADLLERNGVLELGIEVAQDLGSKGAVQKMASHQMAAAHKRVMELMQESASASDPDIAIKMVRASARLMDAFNRAALTLDRLQRGGAQTIQVQYMQVNTTLGGDQNKMQNPSVGATCQGGRPPTTGYRTNKAIAQRKADRDLLSRVEAIEDIG